MKRLVYLGIIKKKGGNVAEKIEYIPDEKINKQWEECKSSDNIKDDVGELK